MLKKLAAAAVTAFSFATLAMAAVNFDNPRSNNITEELNGLEISLPAPAPAEMDKKPVKAKEWTIMVYVNAKNNLERYGIKDMNEMEMVGSSDKVNVVVEMGRMKGFDSSNGDWVGTRRYLVKKDADTANVTSPVVADLGKTDMGDYKNVTAFVKWAKATYPAKKTMLVVWNHGAGWIKSDKQVGGEKGISYDDETGSHITTPQLGALLKDAGGVDVYGSDACLMQMAEVVYEIKDYVPYIVGSEETEPGDGYTYNDMLAPIVAKPAMSAEELGKAVVDAYSDHYAGIDEGSTQSLLKSAAIPGMLNAVDEFAYALIQAGEKALVKSAMDGAQSYAYAENKDLYHFAQIITGATQNAGVKAKGEALMKYISGTLIVHNRTTNGSGGWYGPVDYSNSHGMAVYLPPSAPAAGYMDLQWAKASNWDEFIAWYQQP